MNHAAVEKQRVAGVQRCGHGFLAGRRLDQVAEVAVLFVGLFRALHLESGRLRHDKQTAVLRGGRINRRPCGDAAARLHVQVEVILVKCLAARTGRFEIIHALGRNRFLAEQHLQDRLDPWMKQFLLRQRVVTMRLHDARKSFENIGRVRFRFPHPGGRGPFPVYQRREMIGHGGNLIRTENAGHDEITLFLEERDLVGRQSGRAADGCWTHATIICSTTIQINRQNRQDNGLY